MFKKGRRCLALVLTLCMLFSGIPLGAFAEEALSLSSTNEISTTSPETTESPTPEPTAEPTEEPLPDPTETPTPEPTEEPTPKPTEAPTEVSIPEPTAAPIPEPTEAPTPQPTGEPISSAPEESPTPSPQPSAIPDIDDANGDGYHDGDVAVINAIIEINGLNAYKDDFTNWDFAYWNNEVPCRITSLELGWRQLTGSLKISNLVALSSLNCENNLLDGLELGNLPVLEYLGCSNNAFPTLDLSQIPSLKKLFCMSNKLTALDLSQQSNLTELVCWDNQLTSLDLSNLTMLTVLDCGSNSIGNLNLSGPANLTKLTCNSNQLTSLDLSGQTSLTALNCGDNNLTALDLDGLTALDDLYCSENNLTSLDLSQQTLLTQFSCHSNQIATLNLSAAKDLIFLNCQSNQLSELNITGLSKLERLYCNWNQLTNLNLGGLSSLSDVVTDNNPLKELTSPNKIRLNILSQPNGSGKITAYTCDTNVVNLEAEADLGYHFDCWEGVPHTTENPLSLTMDDHRTLTPVFSSLDDPSKLNKNDLEALRALLTTHNLFDGESIVKDRISTWPATWSSSEDGSLRVTGLDFSYQNITGTLDLTAFQALTTLNYSGNQITALNINGLTALSSVYMWSNSLEILTAPNGFQVSLLPTKGGFGHINSYDPTTNTATLWSIAESPYSFDRWTGSVDSTEQEYSFIVDADKSFTPTFKVDGLNPTDFEALRTLLKEHNLFDDEIQEGDVGTWPADWSGDEADRRVTSLQLENRGLTGTLNVSMFPALTSLSCSNNQLTGLNITGLAKLQSLYCDWNQLSGTLDLSANKELYGVSCYENQLTELNLSGLSALSWINTSGNPFHTLTVPSGAKLQLLSGTNGNGTITEYDFDQNTATVEAKGESGYQFERWSGVEGLYAPKETLVMDKSYSLAPVFCDLDEATNLHQGDLEALRALLTKHSVFDQWSIFEDRISTWPAVWTYSPEGWRITGLSLDNQDISGSLDVSMFLELLSLDCYSNTIQDLNLHGLTKLQRLNCSFNELSGSLDMRSFQELRELLCHNNQLTAIHAAGLTKLWSLSCGDNLLETLNLSGLSALSDVSLYNNPLSSLTAGNGSTLSLMPGVNGHSTISAYMAYTNTAVVMAQPAFSYVFSRWAGSLESTEPRLELEMQGDYSLTPHFTKGVLNPEDVAALRDFLKKQNLFDKTIVEDDISTWPATWSGSTSDLRITALRLNSMGISGTLDLSMFKALTELDCSENEISTLTLKGLTDLRETSIWGNPLTTFTAPNGFKASVLAAQGGQGSIGQYDGESNRATLQASPSQPYRFDRWSGSSTSEDAYFNFTVDSDKNFSPTFQADNLNTSDLEALRKLLQNYKLFGDEIQEKDLSTWPAIWSDTDTDRRVTELQLKGKSLTGTLDVSMFPELVRLYCYDNQLTGTLDVSANKKLDTLNCANNQITDLNITGLSQLSSLDCANNRITGTLDLTDYRLGSLDCSNNLLTGLHLKGDHFHTSWIGVGNNPLTAFTAPNGVKLTMLPGKGGHGEISDYQLKSNTATVEAKNDSGYHFERWSGASDSTEAALELKMDVNRSLTPILWNMDDPSNLNKTDLEALQTLLKKHNLFEGKGIAENRISTWPATWSDEPTNKRVVGLHLSNLLLTGTLDVSMFPELAALDCAGRVQDYPSSFLSGLVVKNLSKLTSLNCQGNQLVELDLQGLSSLKVLNCYYNRITSITNLSTGRNLTDLDCFANQLTNLDLSGLVNLSSLNCAANQLSGTLDASANKELNYLSCSGNPLTALKVNGLTKLADLNITNTKIQSVDLSGLSAFDSLYARASLLSTLVTPEGFQLSASSAKNGRTVINSYGSEYESNMKRVQVEAIPDFGYSFGGWSGALSSADKIAYLTLDSNKTLIPSFVASNLHQGDVEALRTLLNKFKLFGTKSYMNTIISENDISTWPATWSDTSSNRRIIGLTFPESSLSGTLDVSMFTELKTLECRGSMDPAANRLTGLNIQGLTKLTYLSCSNNQLTGTLDLHTNNSLTEIICENNRLESMILTGLEPDWLSIEGNLLSSFTAPNGYKLTLPTAQHGKAVIRGFSTNDNSAHVEPFPHPGYSFSCWSGVSESTDPYISVSLDSNKNLTPVFTQTGVNRADESAMRELLKKHGLFNDKILENDMSTWPANWSNSKLDSRVIALDFSGLKLTGTLDVSMFPELNDLYCSRPASASPGGLSGINTSGLKNLRRLYCSGNQISALDIRSNKNLNTLVCEYNQLNTLDYSGLYILIPKISGNPLSSLTVSNGFQLKLNTATGGTASITSVDYKHNLTIAATPNQGAQFTRWSGDYSSTENPAKLFLSKNLSVTPVFSGQSVPLSSFTLNKTAITLNQGKTEALSVTSYTPANTTSDKIATWKSSDTGVATVDGNGLVTAISGGKATISCTVASITQTCSVAVNVPLSSFSLNKTAITLNQGKTAVLSVTSYTPANTTSDKTAAWKSSDTGVATVDGNGLVKAVAGGKTTISCTVAGITQTCLVTVNAPLTSFALNKTSLSLNAGQTYGLKVASYTPANTTSSKTAVWKSSNTKIATVDSKGGVKGIAPGKATITCTVAEISKTCAITVAAPLTSFALNKTSLSLSTGKTYPLKITAYTPTNTTSSKTASWKSSNTKIATVDSKGVVRGIATGKATITCTVAGINKICSVTVGIPLTAFTLNKAAITVNRGKTYSLKVASYTPTNTTSSKTASWKSSNTKIATVDSKGVVKGIAKGSATITCTISGISKTCKVTIGVPITSFTLSKTSLSVNKGKTYALSVKSYTPSDTTSSKAAKWKSSNTKIVTVDSKGVVKGISKGTATITCTVSGISKTCKVTVAVPMSSFTLSKTSLSVNKGKTAALSVKSYSPSDTTSSKAAKWKSSNTKIATVDSKGVVKGIAKGTTTITCTVSGINKACKVTVAVPMSSFTLSKTSLSVNKGKTAALSVKSYAPSDTTSSKAAKWKSSNTKIASVDSKGVVKGISKGTATITCTVSGISKTCKVTVAVPMTSFALSKTSLSVSKGKTYSLKVASYSPNDTTSSRTAKWKSSNTKIATVDSQGVVKGIAKGTATITCTVSGISKTCKVTVTVPSTPVSSTVYWTPSGKSYHSAKNCATLKRSKTIYSGSVSQAKSGGHSSPCKVCH